MDMSFLMIEYGRCVMDRIPLLKPMPVTPPTGKGEMAGRMEVPNGHLAEEAVGVVEHRRELLPHH